MSKNLFSLMKLQIHNDCKSWFHPCVQSRISRLCLICNYKKVNHEANFTLLLSLFLIRGGCWAKIWITDEETKNSDSQWATMSHNDRYTEAEAAQECGCWCNERTVTIWCQMRLQYASNACNTTHHFYSILQQ